MTADVYTGTSWTLEDTPTWAVATVCAAFVSVGLLVAFGFEKLEHMLKSADRKALVHAVKKMREELMLLGFISLLLSVFQNYVSSICVKTSILEHWAPCHNKHILDSTASSTAGRRRLLSPHTGPTIDWAGEPILRRRILSNQAVAHTCAPGHIPFVSTETMHQLHTFIFTLAIVHILYSVFAMLMAFTKVNGWRAWEDEAQNQATKTDMHEIVKSMSLQRQATFVKHHTSSPCSTNACAVWILCFFRQFGRSVVKSDYLALRLAFIETHNTDRQFDFHNYMIRSLEDEYEKVVGMSAPMWAIVVFIELFDSAGTNLFFWIAFIPAVVTIVVGTKLQCVIANLALESAGFSHRGSEYIGTLKPRDELFWFNRPEWILKCIHFVFFQNAFEMASFLSYVWQFGIGSCLLSNKPLVYTRIGVSVLVQILCSYSTLPLYALVIQMGSKFKHAICKEHVKDELHLSRKGAKHRVRKSAGKSNIPSGNCKRHGPDSGSDADDFDKIYEGEYETRFNAVTLTRSHSLPSSAFLPKHGEKVEKLRNSNDQLSLGPQQGP